jgi:3,4-dihydroxy 2-butanone 4-phosphate synthase/GTP cyclohydrolase II
MARRHGIKMCSVAQIIEHRLTRESLVKRIAPLSGRTVRTEFGEFNALAFESVVDALPHLVLTAGGVGQLDAHGSVIPTPRPTLVRMHRRHLLGDVFGDLESSESGSTGDVLRASMREISRERHGAIVYLRTAGTAQPGSSPDGRSEQIDLEGQLQTMRLSLAPDTDTPTLTDRDGLNAMPMTQREFGIGGQLLRSLGLCKLRLLTNHNRDMPGLDAFGLEIVERVALRR